VDSDSSGEDGNIGDGPSFYEFKKTSAQQGEGTYKPLGPG
jgi:hypothetical protein